MNKIIKQALVVAVLSLLLVPIVAVQAQDINTTLGMNTAQALNLPGTANTPQQAALQIVRYLMTFLGIIAVVIILYGGFQWLTAGGNEDKVGAAKKTIIAGIIGLIIIIAAYAIVQIVVGFAVNIVNGTA